MYEKINNKESYPDTSDKDILSLKFRRWVGLDIIYDICMGFLRNAIEGYFLYIVRNFN